jgi:hypothetical protein
MSRRAGVLSLLLHSTYNHKLAEIRKKWAAGQHGQPHGQHGQQQQHGHGQHQQHGHGQHQQLHKQKSRTSTS